MDLPLSEIKGVGKARLEALNAAGLNSVRDIIMYLPRSYRDMTDITPLKRAVAGESAAFRVRVAGSARLRRIKRLSIVSVFVEDDSSVMEAVWFNQPWLAKSLTPGRELLLYGKTEMRGNRLQLISPTLESGQSIIPVYRPIAGIPQKSLREIIRRSLEVWQGQWRDELPSSIRERFGLCERNFAMMNAHFPMDAESLNAARRRIAFEELLLFQAALSLRRAEKTAGVRIDTKTDQADEYWRLLEFPPTGAQRRVLDEILTDMRSDMPMARLVQGDVGCGKTAVAFGCMYFAAKAGFQSALMAPTEVLAAQHYEGAVKLFGPLGIRVGLLTGSLSAKEHAQAHAAVKEGEWDIIIGTHALITDKVEYKNLGLVITDEQHRFGVRQRSMLGEKGSSPNVLVMSATPIPRTLSLILYGDLDISIIDELPAGRQPVKTRIVPANKRDGMYDFIKAEIDKGRQAYVVCPLVEDSEAIDAVSAEEMYESLSKIFSEYRVALVHGRQKPAEKDALLEEFRTGKIDLLVSTTVIEVGVNVPNATIMVIENAERFGLAQLHQLRGRVGRGGYGSWCFLLAEPDERLRLLVSTNDGFVIAQKDMELRGAGEMFGYRQTGVIDAGLTMLAGNTELLKLTHDEIRRLIDDHDSDEAKQIFSLARETFNDRLNNLGMN